MGHPYSSCRHCQVAMPVRRHARPHKKNFNGDRNHLVDTGREVEVKLGAEFHVLLVRGRYWCSEANTRTTPDEEEWEPEIGSARRLKELCAYKRNSMVRQANYISSRYRADVYIYMTRNGRWYSHEAKFVIVSYDRDPAWQPTDEGRIVPAPSNSRPSGCAAVNFPSARLHLLRRTRRYTRPSNTPCRIYRRTRRLQRHGRRAEVVLLAWVAIPIDHEFAESPWPMCHRLVHTGFA